MLTLRCLSSTTLCFAQLLPGCGSPCAPQAGCSQPWCSQIPAGSLFSSRFSNLGVLHVTKKNMMEIMKEKLKQQKMRNRSHLLTGEGSLGAQWDSAPEGDQCGAGVSVSLGGWAGEPGAPSPRPA